MNDNTRPAPVYNSHRPQGEGYRVRELNINNFRRIMQIKTSQNNRSSRIYQLMSILK